METYQKKLNRVRPPRVHITYDVEIGDAFEMRELPLVVGVLADLSGKPEEPLPPLKQRPFATIDRDNFTEIMQGCKVRLPVKVNNVIEGGDAQTNIVLQFANMDAFLPSELVKQIPVTAPLYKARCSLRDFQAKLDGNDPLDALMDELFADETKQTALVALFDEVEDPTGVEPDEFVTRMLTEGQMALDESQQGYALKLIAQFAIHIIKNAPETPAKFASDRISDRIAEIDNLLTRQVNLVMHEPDFQKLEATWRGLHFLVMNTETSTSLKIRLLNVSKGDLLKDLQKAVEFDQSVLFKKVYEEEFGTFGGDPFSFLIGDYEFGRHPQDMELLEKISGVAAAAHAPFIAAAYAKLFDLPDYFNLTEPRDLSKIFESEELIKWNSFRESDDSRYVSLTLPKVLLRLPYGPETVVVESFDFQEEVDGRDASRYLWGNPAFVLGQRITNAFALHGWLAAIRGVEGGGLVEGLPAHIIQTPSGDKKITCPTQVSISDRREKELNDLGFMAILHCKGTDKAAFFGGKTTNLPKKYNTDAANANAELSSMLPYILNSSRFAHYIKVIMRDKIGSFATKENVSEYLNNWISNYILSDDAAPQEMKASYPLRDGRIDVSDIPGSPGKYRATVFLRPHFQLEELTTSIRLVAELP